MFKKLPDYATALKCYQGHNQYGFVYIGGSVESPATLSRSKTGDLVVMMESIPVITYKWSKKYLHQIIGRYTRHF